MKSTDEKKRIRYQLKSFSWAINGFLEFFRTEVKSKIHLFFAALAIIAAVYFNVSETEWMLLAIVITIVFISEIINTTIERLADNLPDNNDRQRGLIKDLGAAAVLVSAILAIVIASIIFIPKTFSLLCM